MTTYGDIARFQASDEHDVVVEVKHDAYFAGIARRGFFVLPEYCSQPYATEAEARREANRYYALVRSGDLSKFSRGVSLYRRDDLAGMHERQREVLATIPRRHRRVVLSRAHLLQNLGGGILSGCLWTAAQEYRRVGPSWALERMSQRDNHAAMRSCAKKGCEACARSVS